MFEFNDFTLELIFFVIKLLFTFIATKIFNFFWRKTFKKDTIHLKFIKNIFGAIIWIAGVAYALSSFSQFEDFAVALFAGSGIVALTIGLAAQESLGNALNGLFISIFKPFEVGDRVHLVNANITGFIEDISIRHTVIRTFMNSRVIIPNSIINKELIENSNFNNPRASAFIDVIVTYDSDMPLAREILALVVGDHEEYVDTRTPEQFVSTPKVPVFVRSLGLYGAELRASMWTETIANNFSACSDVRKTLIEEFGKAGIKISTVKYAGGLE